MNCLYTIICFTFGIVLGSFYNVVGYRLPQGKSLVKPRSECPKCHKKLKWYELIPVISFLIQRGKCNNCKCKISLFYPIIEITTGILFALDFYLFGFSYKFIILLIVISLFNIVLVSDINFLIIPDEVTIVATILVIITNLSFLELEKTIYMFFSGCLLFVIMYIVMILGNILFKKESLGGADIKLMILVGMILTPIDGIFCIFISSVLALPISIFLLLKNKNNIIPYGPFILGALLLILFCNIDVNTLLNLY